MTVPVNGSPDMSDSERFDLLHSWTCEKYSLSHCKRRSEGTFEASASSATFGPLVVGRVKQSGCSAMDLRRGPSEIRRDARDHFQFIYVLSGRFNVAQDDRKASAGEGQVFIYRQDRPFALSIDDDTECITLNVPRPCLVTRLPDASRWTATALPRGTKFGRLTRGVLRQLAEFDHDLDTPQAGRIGMSALDIIIASLEADMVMPAALSRSQTDLLNRAKSFMRGNLHDPELTVEGVAHALGVSRRTLNRLFVSEGVTPMRWLWHERLLASRRSLIEGEFCQVTDVAFNFGFSDLSHFSRSFKEAFGVLPSSLKKR